MFVLTPLSLLSSPLLFCPSSPLRSQFLVVCSPLLHHFLPSALVLFISLSRLSDVTRSQWIECHFSAVIKVRFTAVHSGVWWQDEREGVHLPLSSHPFFLHFLSKSCVVFHSLPFFCHFLTLWCFIYCIFRFSNIYQSVYFSSLKYLFTTQNVIQKNS